MQTYQKLKNIKHRTHHKHIKTANIGGVSALDLPHLLQDLLTVDSDSLLQDLLTGDSDFRLAIHLTSDSDLKIWFTIDS